MVAVIAAVLAVAGVGFVLYPLLRPVARRERSGLGQGNLTRELEWEKQAAYAAIRDLDFEHRTGKLSDEDYRELSDAYRAQALKALKACDDARGTAMEAVPSAGGAPQRNSPLCPQCAHVNPTGANFCEVCGVSLTSLQVCSNCGVQSQSGDRFCGVCGARL